MTIYDLNLCCVNVDEKTRYTVTTPNGKYKSIREIEFDVIYKGDYAGMPFDIKSRKVCGFDIHEGENSVTVVVFPEQKVVDIK